MPFREPPADIGPFPPTPNVTCQIILEQRDDEHGFLRRSLELQDDGTLVLSGHDLGRGVSDAFRSGLKEYEFARTVEPTGVQQLYEALKLDTSHRPCRGDPESLRRTRRVAGLRAVPGGQRSVACH
jgi:hypothetical protein